MAAGRDIMAGVDYWEHQLVTKYVIKPKQERYLTLLKGKKHRQKFLDQLNHKFDLDPRYATELAPAHQSVEGLHSLLRSRYVGSTCYLVADGNENDGREMQLSSGVSTLLGNHWGAILICPPKPIVVYKEEAPGRLVLLEVPTT